MGYIFSGVDEMSMKCCLTSVLLALSFLVKALISS